MYKIMYNVKRKNSASRSISIFFIYNVLKKVRVVPQSSCGFK